MSRTEKKLNFSKSEGPNVSTETEIDGNVYDNKDSKVTYSIESPIARQQHVYTRLPWGHSYVYK